MQSVLTPIELDGTSVSVASTLRHSSDKWLLCLHGLQSNKLLFERLFRDPRFENFSIIAPDFLGFGESSKPESCSYDLSTQLDVISQLLNHHNICEFHLIGHSLGGMIGTMLYSHQDFKLNSLISLEGNLILADCSKSREVSDLSEEEFTAVAYPELKALLLESSEPSAKLRAEGLKQIPAYVFLRTSKSIVKYSESEELLRMFLQGSTPRLFILGENGTCSSRPQSEYIQILSIPDAGHFMLLDNPSATFGGISDFLNRVAACSPSLI